MNDLGDLMILLFGAAVLCIGALAIAFIGDGYGKFRAPFRSAEEEFDRQAVAGQLQMPEPAKPDLYIVPPPPPSRLYDQEKDGYI